MNKNCYNFRNSISNDVNTSKSTLRNDNSIEVKDWYSIKPIAEKKKSTKKKKNNKDFDLMLIE